MRFKLTAVHSKPLYGIPPTGKRVEMPEVGIMHVVEGKWKESWYFGDELGLLMQFGLVNEILG
jgi:predicted ester cyclase